MMIKDELINAIYLNLNLNIKYTKFKNDCINIIFKILKDANILFRIPDLTRYNIHKINKLKVLKNEIIECINPLYGVYFLKFNLYEKLDTGDVLLFGNKDIVHAGFYLKGGDRNFDEIAHSVEDRGFIKTRLITLQFKILYIIRFYKI